MDASISHASEGIHGEVFISCLVALSFFKQEPEELIQEVLQGFIPPESYYFSIIEQCLKWHSKFPNWRRARKELMYRWKEIRKELERQSRSVKRKLLLRAPKVHKIHVLPNAGIVTLGLLYGQGNFEKSSCITALCGYDIDCNFGNVGTILGVQIGSDQIPAKWKDPIRDTFNTYVRGFQETRISKIAERIIKIGAKVIISKYQNIQLGIEAE